MARKTVKRRLADGSVREYVYTAEDGNSMKALVLGYQQSAAYKHLAPSSKKSYKVHLDKIVDEVGNVRVQDVKRRNIKQMMDKYTHMPSTANELLKLMRLLLAYAVDQEYVQYNVATGIKKFAGGSHNTWKEEEIEFAISNVSDGMAKAIQLALHTGQRVGDCAKMKWSDYDGYTIHVIQEKTKKELWVPVSDKLKDLLAEWKTTAKAETILESSLQRPWSSGNSVSCTWTKEKKKWPELSGLPFHGLRKSAAVSLALAGCSVHEIASITGHKSLKEIERYTAEADQKRLSEGAMRKLEAFSKREKI